MCQCHSSSCHCKEMLWIVCQQWQKKYISAKRDLWHIIGLKCARQPKAHMRRALSYSEINFSITDLLGGQRALYGEFNVAVEWNADSCYYERWSVDMLLFAYWMHCHDRRTRHAHPWTLNAVIILYNSAIDTDCLTIYNTQNNFFSIIPEFSENISVNI